VRQHPPQNQSGIPPGHSILPKALLRLAWTVRGAALTPDFIFPGEKEYHDTSFDESLLVMLGVKSTSKDRWRQILTEADRIRNKHLCTLEPSISTRQTDEMVRHHLTLVVPERLHETYTADQRRALLRLSDFIDCVRHKQGV
jgi:hypothetical protein